MKYQKIINGSLFALFLILLGLNGYSAGLKSAGLKVIANPKATVVEQKYVELKESLVIGDDLGDDHVMFSPRSFTSDAKGFVYVYDNLQNRIFKFDKNFKVVAAFGSRGQGPGEFSGTGMTRPVYIKIGGDGKLYANDIRAHKVLVFNSEGRFLKDFKYGFVGRAKRPVVDKSGNIHLFAVDLKENLSYITPDKQVLYEVGTIDQTYSFLFSEPEFEGQATIGKQKYHKRATALEMNRTDMTLDGKVLSFFPSNSTLLVLKDNKILRRLKLWPRHALELHKENLPKIMKRQKGAFRNLFFNLFVDGDDPGYFYLQFGRDEQKQMNYLYRFNLEGKLSKVFYIKYEEKDGFTLFRLKSGGRFYAIREEKIITYKEN